jgi:hypothetical protein
VKFVDDTLQKMITVENSKDPTGKTVVANIKSQPNLDYKNFGTNANSALGELGKLANEANRRIVDVSGENNLCFYRALALQAYGDCSQEKLDTLFGVLEQGECQLSKNGEFSDPNFSKIAQVINSPIIIASVKSDGAYDSKILMPNDTYGFFESCDIAPILLKQVRDKRLEEGVSL